MDNIVVEFKNDNEKKELENYLKLNDFKWTSGGYIDLRECVFPICVNIKEKTIAKTSTYFLKEHKQKGSKILTIEEFLKVNMGE